MKRLFFKLIIIVLSFCLMSFYFIDNSSHNYFQKNTTKCSKRKMLKVAKKEIREKYGWKTYIKNMPYYIDENKSNDSVTVIRGTVKSDKGGSPYVHISKNDCTIKYISHDR